MTEVEKLEEQKKKLKEKCKAIQAKEALLFYKFANTHRTELSSGEKKTIYELYKRNFENWLKARESKRKNRKDDGEKNHKDDVAPGRAQ